MTARSLSAGDIFINNSGSRLEVVGYVGRSNLVRIRFLDGNAYEYEVDACSVRRGNTKNPYHPSVCGVGFTGVGKYRSWDGCRMTEQYKRWVNMMKRCYDPKTHEHDASYLGCTVDPRWHNLQAFGSWYDANSVGLSGSLHLDKDILKRGNKIYGPDTCALIPDRINTMLTVIPASDLPVGVTLRKDTGRFSARGRGANGKHKSLGSFDCPIEAFMAYKAHKESAVKEVANEYKDEISSLLYEALMNYQVEP